MAILCFSVVVAVVDLCNLARMRACLKSASRSMQRDFFFLPLFGTGMPCTLEMEVRWLLGKSVAKFISFCYCSLLSHSLCNPSSFSVSCRSGVFFQVLFVDLGMNWNHFIDIRRFSTNSFIVQLDIRFQMMVLEWRRIRSGVLWVGHAQLQKPCLHSPSNGATPLSSCDNRSHPPFVFSTGLPFTPRSSTQFCHVWTSSMLSTSCLGSQVFSRSSFAIPTSPVLHIIWFQQDVSPEM